MKENKTIIRIFSSLNKRGWLTRCLYTYFSDIAILYAKRGSIEVSMTLFSYVLALRPSFVFKRTGEVYLELLKNMKKYYENERHEEGIGLVVEIGDFSEEHVRDFRTVCLIPYKNTPQILELESKIYFLDREIEKFCHPEDWSDNEAIEKSRESILA